MNVNIQISEIVLEKMKSLNIAPDNCGSVLFVLIAMHEGKMELLDRFDDSSTTKRALVLYRLLFRRNLLVENCEKDAKYLYSLSKKGVEIAKWLRQNFDDDITDLQPSLEKLVVPIVETEMSWEQFSEEFVNVFPKSHRANSKVALIRLERFFKVFPEYKNQQILISAAKLYVKENLEKDESLKFMRHCQYFIFKAEGKEVIYELANWCARVESSKNNEETTYDLSFLNTA